MYDSIISMIGMYKVNEFKAKLFHYDYYYIYLGLKCLEWRAM